MRAKQEVKGFYALIEAFWDITKAINCSIRGAILVAFCFLGGGIVVIGLMFVIGHNHDKQLAAEIRAHNEALAKMSSQSSAHMIPMAPQYNGYPQAHHGYPQAHHYAGGLHPHTAASNVQNAYPAHQAAHDPYSATHPTYSTAYPTNEAYPAHAAFPAHAAYPAQAGYARQQAQPPGFRPTHQMYPAAGSVPNAYQAATAYPAATASPRYASTYPDTRAYPQHGYYPHHGYQQPINPIAVDPIYDSSVTRSQYNQMMQTTPMVASPYGNNINFNNNPAPIDQPPAEFGVPRTHSNTAVADANEFAGADSGRAEAEESPSVLNTY